jgi:hypothetical protein
MNEPRQKLMETLGDEGCYVHCIVHLGEGVVQERVDTIPVFLDALDKKHAQMNCLVLDAAAILGSITGVEWVKRNEGPDYERKPGELEIQRWERKSGKGSTVHFVVAEESGIWDPYGNSRTVREGVLVSKRIFSRA